MADQPDLADTAVDQDSHHASFLIILSSSSVECLLVPRSRNRSTSARPRPEDFADLNSRNPWPSSVGTNSTSVLGNRPKRSRRSCGMVT